MIRVRIVSPARPEANNGNAHTAARWQRFLAPRAEVDVALAWNGEPVDALIALHARRSADSIARFRAAHPQAPLGLVLTGTDLYRDFVAGDASVAHSLKCATRVVVLQGEALHRLPADARAKALVIEQSATRVRRHDQASGSVDFVAVGHLRDEKDPLTLMRAAQRLRDDAGLRVIHIGGALDESLADAARRTMSECSHYRWLGAQPAGAARRWIARSRALVHMSRMEGGANVVIEALRSGVPVLASRIDGNVGLLGRGYEGYFEQGDDAALAALMRRFAGDRAFAEHLAAQCAAREARFDPAVEAAAVRALLNELLAAATIAP
jgi:putative glycosyltransferase (TIGR04348 family)